MVVNDGSNSNKHFLNVKLEYVDIASKNVKIK